MTTFQVSIHYGKYSHSLCGDGMTSHKLDWACEQMHAWDYFTQIVWCHVLQRFINSNLSMFMNIKWFKPSVVWQLDGAGVKNCSIWCQMRAELFTENTAPCRRWRLKSHSLAHTAGPTHTTEPVRWLLSSFKIFVPSGIRWILSLSVFISPVKCIV